MWQADWVAAQLRHRGHEVEIIEIVTRGDSSKESLSQVGGQGVFTKEIQNALLSETVDVAVHSLKDLPTVEVPGLMIGAVPERETTADCLISRAKLKFEDLPSGARIGTGSTRRGAQLLAWRSDISIADIRGNVDSRLRKLEEGQYDAIILAAAGLTRLKLLHHATQELPSDKMLPAIGQGALGLECRCNDTATQTALKELNHQASLDAVTAERQLLASLLAGCLAPVAASAEVRGETLSIKARVLATDGSRMVEGEISGMAGEAKQLGKQLADELKIQGAEQLIAAARNEP